jgi:raffinose/stachyose/melibiose transport system permease protein
MQPNATIYKRRGPLAVFLIPAFAFMALFLYYPFLMNLMNAVCRISGLGTAAEGLNTPWYKNFAAMLTDAKLHTAFGNTLLMMLATVVFEVGIALVLALLVDNIRRGVQFFRTVYFFPIVISATALGLLFNLIFLYNGGMLNALLLDLGWIRRPSTGRTSSTICFTMLLPVVWQYVGFYFVILATGLNNISPDLYEAAAIDGAAPLQRVTRITLPLLHNTLCICLTLAITGALKVFDLPWIMMGEGMPMDRSWLLGTYMYHTTFNAGDVDYGSAIAVVIVVVGVAVSQLANAVFKEKDY